MTANNDISEVALVYDKFLVRGGGERVFDVIASAYPKAPIYALNAYPKKEWENRYNRPIHIPPLGWIFRSRIIVILLYPLACFLMSRLVIKARLVIVYSSSCGKYVQLNADRSLLYSNYPNRGVFELSKVIKNPVLRVLATPFAKIFRTLEIRQFEKYPCIASISNNARESLKKYTGINSIVLHCPYNKEAFDGSIRNLGASKKRDIQNRSFLMVSRLEPEKELEYAIAAFQNSTHKLRIAGVGSLYNRLKRRYSATNIEFLGFISDDQLASEIEESIAVLFPSDIEYSLVPIEVNSLGKAVIAFDSSAARELLIDWSEDPVAGTAIMYKEKNGVSMFAAINTAMNIDWDPAVLRHNATRFEPKEFIASLRLLTQ